MKNTIKCPHCKSTIDIESALSHRLEEQRLEFEQKSIQIRELAEKDSESKISKLLEQVKAADQRATEMAEKARLETHKKSMAELENREKELRAKYRAEQEELEQQKKLEYAELEKKLFREAEEAASKKQRLENESLQKRIVEAEEEREALVREKLDREEQLYKLRKNNTDQLEEMQRQMRRASEEAKGEAAREARRQMEEEMEEQEKKHKLREEDLKRQLEDQKKHAEEAVRKVNQGSMERQGEVFEDYIKDQIKREFPFDEVEDVQKGINGADLVLTVKSEAFRSCGDILIEVKRTKTFGSNWISKLKNDLLAKGAKVGIIITQTLPADVRKFDIIDGVYICSEDIAMPLIKSLRKTLLEIDALVLTQVGKDDKIEKLYDFMTSKKFSEPFGAVIRTYDSLRLQLEKEKRSVQKSWKIRESALSDVFDSMNAIYGQIQYIAGGNVSVSELDEDEYEDYEEVASDKLNNKQDRLLEE